MVLTAIFGSLAILSVALLLWQWVVALRFPLHRRCSSMASQPGVTLLKPLKGADEFSETCLRSWFAQQYEGALQILFGVASPNDPACNVVRNLLREYPKADAQLIVCGALEGTNAKVSKLIQLEKLAKHDLLVISDADVRVPPDLLSNLVVPLSSEHATRSTQYATDSDLPTLPRSNAPTSALTSSLSPRPLAGLVNCFYSLANPSTPAMHWEAVAINADFWSQVLQAQSLKPLDFALGAVMATTKPHLQGIGGFDAIKNCLADDYQLGQRIAKNGGRIVLCPVPVECFSGAMGWRAVWKHQLRWARTIRVSQPLPYFFSILSNATLWPCIWAVLVRMPLSLWFAVGAIVLRIWLGLTLQRRLTRARVAWPQAWLIPVKDLLQAAIWAGAFMGNSVEWRGEEMRLMPNGDLAKK